MATSLGIDISILPTVWKDCTGFDKHFASDSIMKYVTPPSSGYSTQKPESFRSPRLANSLFHEAQHYADRAIYHLIIGKWMIAELRPTWGMVSYYYSAFFSAQCAIRLGGTFFSKISYESEINTTPTHRIDVKNLTNGEYQIRKSSPKGEHQRVWSAFYDRYSQISSRNEWRKFLPITAISDNEERLAEMHRRHLLNYVPGLGYIELRSPKDSMLWCDLLTQDLPSDLARHINHEDCQLEVRALLRFEFCQRLFQKIADQQGLYSIHHYKFCDKRKTWLVEYSCPQSLAAHLNFILTPTT